MLKKLLKYDLRAIFRLWWIAALVTVIVSVFGGFCARLLASSDSLNWSVITMLSLGSGLSTICSLALPVLTLVLIFIRFYKNFFTDEGYLTFTLPVSRRTLMLSKIISGTIGLCSAVGVCLFNAIIKTYIQEYNTTQTTPDTPTVETMEVIYFLIYMLEALIAAVLLIVCTLLFLYACITFAAMIVRKGKLIAAIGISYGAFSSAFILFQLFLLIGIYSISTWVAPLSQQATYGVLALMGLAGILLLGIMCCVFYILQQLMLDRKLNLS